MFSQEPLDDIAERLREFATELTQKDAEIADEVLLARTELESALEADNPSEHLQNAHTQLDLAQQIDKINKNYQQELTEFIDALEPHIN